MSIIKKELVELLKKIPPYHRRNAIEEALSEIKECYFPYPITIKEPIEKTLKRYVEKLKSKNPDLILQMISPFIQTQDNKKEYEIVIELEKYNSEKKDKKIPVSIKEFIAFNLKTYIPEEYKIFMEIRNKKSQKKFFVCNQILDRFNDPSLDFYISSKQPKGENVFIISKQKPA